MYFLFMFNTANFKFKIFENTMDEQANMLVYYLIMPLVSLGLK